MARQGLATGLINLFFPPKCYLCNSLSQELVCERCRQSLPLIADHICIRCGKPSHYTVDKCRECRGKRLYFKMARSLGLYEGGLKEAIHCFKYQNGKNLAPLFSDLILSSSLCDAEFWKVDLVTCVPSTAFKVAKRGYNQAAVLAKEIALRIGKPNHNTIHRTRRTKDQNKLSLDERRENVKGAFRVVPPARDLKGCHILLVDDVYTTGSTINECAQALKKAGAGQVNVLTIARATLNY